MIPLYRKPCTKHKKGNIVYNKELETDALKNAEHQLNLKKAAADRLAKNAKWKRENKAKSKS